MHWLSVVQVLATRLQRGMGSLFTRLNAEADYQALREQGTGFDRLWLKPDGWLLVCGGDQAFDGALGAVEMVAVEGDVRRRRQPFICCCAQSESRSSAARSVGRASASTTRLVECSSGLCCCANAIMALKVSSLLIHILV